MNTPETMKRCETMEEAESWAVKLTKDTGDQYVAYKSDYAFSPYVAARLPQVGDDVSMGFNGDYYPCGKIVKISKTYKRITTEDGCIFTQVGPNNWKQGGKGGAFSLVRGTRDERNPHF